MKKINTVYLAEDLTIFCNIVGNRSVENVRVQKIIESVRRVGFIEAPIICNEKMEVIDGQGRLEACKRLGLPIPYIIIEGLTIKECRAMNIYQSNWRIIDYIESYANQGNQNYKRLLKFVNESIFSIQTSLYIALISDSTNKTDDIKAGTIKFSEKDYDRAVECETFLRLFKDINPNRSVQFVMGLVFCFLHPEIDNDRLVKKVHQAPKAFGSIANTLDCIETLEDVYNRRSREHFYLKTEYQKWLAKKGVLKAIESKIKK